MRDVVLVRVATVAATAGRPARTTVGADLVRALLAEATGADPSAIGLDRAPDGRLLVLRPEGWHASVGHTDRVVVGAVARRPVGIDVEARPGPPPDPTFVRRTCTPAEVEALERLGPAARAEALLRAWVRKEAVAKGLGRGVHEPFDRLDVRRRSVVAADGSRWSVRDVALPAPSGPDLVAAVAAPGRRWRVRRPDGWNRP